MKKLILSISLLLAMPIFASGVDSVHPADITHFIQTHNPLVYLTVFFGLGLFLAFTPCVLPMVPILSGIITGQSAQNQERSFALSLAYVLGMAVTYAIAGMLAAYFGSTVQSLMQQPIIIVSFSGLFVLMACWLLGVFELRLPAFLSRGQQNQTPKRTNLVSAALMGILSTLIVSPCVTAPLIGVLTYIAQSGHVAQGGILLFVLALGMGLPLLLVGAGYGKLLPKTGPWMIKIKQLFAILMMAMAVWLLGRVLPSLWVSLLWAGLLAISAFILGIARHEPHPIGRALQVVAVIALMSSGALTYKSIWAESSIHSQAVVLEAPFITVSTPEEINNQLAIAKSEHRRVFLEFFATWCSDCQGMEKHVFNQPEIITAMDGAMNIKVNLSKKNEAVATIKKTFGIYGIPTMIFYTTEGEQLNQLTSVGPISKDQMLHLLEQSKR